MYFVYLIEGEKKTTENKGTILTEEEVEKISGGEAFLKDEPNPEINVNCPGCGSNDVNQKYYILHGEYVNYYRCLNCSYNWEKRTPLREKMARK